MYRMRWAFLVLPLLMGATSLSWISMASDVSAAYSYEALIDADNNPSTGGNVAVVQGDESPHDITGIEFRVMVHLTGNTGELGPIVTHKYNAGSGSFDLVNTESVFYDLGFGNGINGSDVIEFEAPLGVVGTPGTFRIVYHASAAHYNDYTRDFIFSGEKMVPVPALGSPALIFLMLLLLASALWMILRQRRLRGNLSLALVALLILSGYAWALGIVLDGQVNDWLNMSPLVTDPVGDSSSGDPYEDIVAGFVTADGDKLYLRMDVVGKQGEDSAVELEKNLNGEDADLPPGPYVPAGEAVTWTYMVTNTGNVQLSDVEVTDDQGVSVICPGGSLAVGEAMNCTGSATAGSGSYSNLGSVSGKSPSGATVADTDPCHYFGESPAIGLEKWVNGEDADLPPGPTISVGSPVAWTYVVTNLGDVNLTNVLVIDDQGVTVTCPKSGLAPGESMTCTGQGVATTGQYVNLGTASGNSPSGVSVQDADPCHYFGESPSIVDEGCTSSYWKNHPGSWPPTGYAPTQSIASVFPGASAYDLGTYTFLEALDFAGGPSTLGAAQIVLRAGVAALLNAAHPVVNYPITPATVISQVGDALASGDRDAMLFLASALDISNNLGCPLS